MAGTYELAPITSADEWRAYHQLRRIVLWEARGRQGYDENHPADRRPGNHPFVLKLDGVPIGTVRLDEIGRGAAAVRLVAVRPDEQRRGHGRQMMSLVEVAARRLGMETLTVNAARDAVGFYTRMGWSPGRWSDPDPGGAGSASDEMLKGLA